MAAVQDKISLAKDGVADREGPPIGQTGIQKRDSENEPLLLW